MVFGFTESTPSVISAMRSISWLPYDGPSEMKWSTSSGSTSRRRSPPVNGSCERVGGRAAGAASGTTPAWATASLAASRLRSRLDPLARAMARHPDRRGSVRGGHVSLQAALAQGAAVDGDLVDVGVRRVVRVLAADEAGDRGRACRE